MWSPQLYLQEGRARQVEPGVLNEAAKQLDEFYARNSDIPAILTLGHLAQRSEVPYDRLRAVVERSIQPYNHFTIRKRSGGRRTISVPSRDLLRAQRWLSKHILNKQSVHSACYAFAPGSSIVNCARRHTGARWLVKMDILGFFGSISEIAVYRVFHDLGYKPLVAFELARLTTCVTNNWFRYRNLRWHNYYPFYTIDAYDDERIGHLPQGAPTSPMLSNLVMKKVDVKLVRMASRNGLVYTRYSDDLAFSKRDGWERSEAKKFVHSVSSVLRAEGYYPNIKKTKIVPPGARKIVLGLIVDGPEPRLSRQFRSKLRQHLYYLRRYGPVEHMKRRRFETLLGMRRHIRGHIDFASMVDEKFARRMLAQFNDVEWPV